MKPELRVNGAMLVVMLLGLLAWYALFRWTAAIATGAPRCDTTYITSPYEGRLTRVVNTCVPGDTVVLRPGQDRTDHFDRILEHTQRTED